MKALVLLAFVVSFLAQFRSSASQDEGLTVQTQQGFVIGTLIRPSVRQFLGIPYASVDRWEPPKPPSNHDSPFEATQFGDSCTQNLGGFFGIGNPTVKESEDCLNLNIWAPALDRPQETAVMIWVYGGAYQSGTSSDPLTQGQLLVENNDDVMLVTFNYRTNIFGFPGAPQLIDQSQSQNFGASDVDAAIQWVFDNIAYFGGNPNRITIFGQSAGSALVAAFTFAHPNDTRVKGVIQQSGSLVGLPPSLTPFGAPFNAQAWDDIAEAVGCGPDDQLDCMRKVPAADLIIKVENMPYPVFVPVQDNITFFTDFDSRSAAGNFLKVPLLVGNTKDEAYIPPDFFPPSLLFPLPALFTKAIFSCPAGSTASGRIEAGVPTFRYRYDAGGSSAVHGADIPIVFGTTGVEEKLSAFVQSAWVAFARNPSEGPTDLGWPRYTPDTDTLAILGNSASNATGISLTNGDLYDFQCSQFVNLANDIISVIHDVFDLLSL